MTFKNWLLQSQVALAKAGITTARLDALVLLEDLSGKDRAWWLAHAKSEISESDTAKLKKLLKMRIKHVPLAYVLGKTEFYGREFIIAPAVLEPRPESETMIDLLKETVTATKDKAYTLKTPVTIKIADVGAGSGALGITAALELANSQVDLLEIDPKAVKVAKMNVDKFTLSISVIESDLLARTSSDYDILLCNLPYVPDDYQINRAALHEPRLAIFGGPDGLDIYRRLFDQTKKLQKCPLFILTESLPPQHAKLQAIARRAGYSLEKTDDFIQQFCLTA